MPDPIFDVDPLDEQMLIESLGGTSPTPTQPAPTPEILALLAKGVQAKQAREAAEQQAAQQAKQIKQQQAKQPTMSVTLKGPLGSVPDMQNLPSGPVEPMPLTPVQPKAPAAAMRAATPEERVLDKIEDPAQQLWVRTQFQGKEKPPPGPTAMRAATTGERISDTIGDLVTKLKSAVQPDAEYARNTTVPEPFHTTVDPTMGSAAPEKAVGEGLEAVVGKLVKGKKPAPFKFAEVDDAARARMASMKTGEGFTMKALPAEARPTAVYNTILETGGISVSPVTGQVIEVGQPGPTMVGKYPNQSPRTMPIPAAQFKPSDVRKFYETNRDAFAKDPEAFVGGWHDKKNDIIYLDVSKGFETTREATKFGELQNPGAVRGKPTGVVRDPVTGLWPKAQEAVFEPETMQELPIGNLRDFIDSDEFQSRVHEMAAIGRKAMGGENPEWWNIVNGPMARVYGKENVEAVAGYLASTSPQNGPVANTQMMTELMRRHLKNEPVRQPDWRAPETAMGKVGSGGTVSEGFSPKPGAKFPNEGTYAANAERVRAGTPEKVQDDKVNDMFHALMGKLVGVFDRHWAKLAEKPQAGIYADAVQNRLAGSMTSGQIEAYPLIENAVRTASKNAGVDISKYSAWVWEGIRDTIRKTGELYGQKHRASAIPETTTGFNEIFENLLTEKAKHLGVSVGKLEEMLRAGDAELLAALLATPVGAAAYARWNAAAEPKKSDGGA